jgi:M6 family metalloprotease-like protein
MGYYGRDTFEEERVVELAETLVGMADAAIDFAQYDHVFIIHAGAGQETDLAGDSRSQLWSSFYDAGDIDAAFPDTTIAGLPTNDTRDGQPFLVDNFSIVPANASQDFARIGTLGIWAFELGSRIGLLPLFDSTPATIPDAQGVGSFCVMSFGLFNFNGFVPSYPCAFNRMIAGWLEPVTVEPASAPQFLRLADVNTGADTDTLCARIPITENEYYLVVNRVHDPDFDSLFTFVDVDSGPFPSGGGCNYISPDNVDSFAGAEFDFYMTDITNPVVCEVLPEYGYPVLLRHTGSGVYIWHVDENVIRETTNAGFLPNDFVERKGVDLEEADGVQDMDGGGVAAFTLGSFFDSYRSGDGNQNAFGPGTDPSSLSNAGVRTGIAIEDISAPGLVMTCVVRLEAPYDDHRVRWDASTQSQPASVLDVDGDGDTEIAVLADSGRVYLFDETGAEYLDGDADPTTIAPFLDIGSSWAGPPALADVYDGTETELLAMTTDGRLYYANSSNSQLVYTGMPAAAPPIVVDVTGDATPEFVVAGSDGDSLYLRLVDSNGNEIEPGEDAFIPLWPVAVQGHYAAPLAWAQTGNEHSPPKAGVVMAWVDTLDSRLRVSFTPARHVSGPLVGEPVARTWTAAFAIPSGYAPWQYVPSAPAVGDIDADGSDEVVITTPDGRLYILENDAGETGIVDPEVIELRAALPSAPALGDTDLDGTLEIAVWDSEYMYLLESNGRLVTEWPQRIVPESVGDLPPATVRRGLESPIIADLDGNGAVDVLFVLGGGEMFAFQHDATATAGFPRVGPAGALAAPSLASVGGASQLSLVTAGNVSAITRVNTVIDSFATRDQATLSIQTLPGSDAGDRQFWSGYRNDGGRSGRVSETVPLETASGSIQAASFMIYPNPVSGNTVNVRVTLNARATVDVQIYNFEGEEAFSGRYNANNNGLTGTPFDEAIDVSSLVSGVYFVRLHVAGDGGSDTLIKPFAIRR